MIHNLLQTVTSATFLLLASLLIYDRWDNNNNAASIEALRKDLQDQNNKNMYYLEARQNSIGARQDDYQIGVNKRLDVLEARQAAVEDRVKNSARVINNNTNINR